MPALLQTFVDKILDPSVVWVLIPLFAISIGFVAVAIEPLTQRLKQNERREARKMYERLMQEKLDILKTAVAMGYSQADLAQLDARLERLVGTEGMQALLADQKKSSIKTLEHEIERGQNQIQIEQVRE